MRYLLLVYAAGEEAAALDTRRNVLVVFGGSGLFNQNAYGDTWEWNGTAWKRMQ